MKKAIFLLVLSLVVVVSFSACGHEHEFGDWVALVTESCTEDGMQERKCNSCDETETQVVPSSGHNFGEWEDITPASCTKDGEHQRTCTVCGYVEKESVKATGHDFESATLTKPKTCKNCGITEGEALATVISKGSEITSDDHSFVVSDYYYTKKVSERKGSTTYNSQDGNYFVIQLQFTNLAAEPFERWHSNRASDMELTFDGKYKYEGSTWIAQDDIVSLDTQKLYIMYDVAANIQEDTSKSVIAAFTIDGKTYAMVINEGSDKSETAQDASGTEKATNVNSSISVGDTRTDGENFEFTVDKVFFTNTVSEKKGSTTYSTGDGNYIVIQMTFTNLSAEPVDSWSSNQVTDMLLTYDGKYEYEGKIWVAENKIVSLDTQKLYIMFDVAATLKDNDGKSLIAKFSMSGNEFSIDCNANR